MAEKTIIRQIWKRKVGNKEQLLITVPKGKGYDAGDYVRLYPVPVKKL